MKKYLLKVLVTAGPTREYLDPVRFISNPSTGAMGYALARTALKRGHRVRLITGPTSLKPPTGAKTFCVTSARQMFKETIRHFDWCQCLIMTAAVCDYRPRRQLVKKMSGQHKNLSIDLVKNPDILKEINKIQIKTQAQTKTETQTQIKTRAKTRRKAEIETTIKTERQRRLIIGFALETGNVLNLIKKAKVKLKKKGLDLIVANLVGVADKVSQEMAMLTYSFSFNRGIKMSKGVLPKDAYSQSTSPFGLGPVSTVIIDRQGREVKLNNQKKEISKILLDKIEKICYSLYEAP